MAAVSSSSLFPSSPFPSSLFSHLLQSPRPAQQCWGVAGAPGTRVAPCTRSILEITEKWPKACTYTCIKPWHCCPVMPKLFPGGWHSRTSRASISQGCSPLLTLLPPRLLGTSATASSNGLGQTPSCSRAVCPICKGGRKAFPPASGKALCPRTQVWSHVCIFNTSDCCAPSSQSRPELGVAAAEAQAMVLSLNLIFWGVSACPDLFYISRE